METLGDDFTSKNRKIFYCKICDFKCSKTGDWNRHLMTSKHKKYVKGDDLVTKGDANYIFYICDLCNKNYISRNGLWKHKKKCQTINTPDLSNKDELIIMLIKQNSELIKEQTDIKQMILDQQNVVLEIAKNGTYNTTTTHTNSYNKAFNLNFFLNETCKDAMNIMDFVDSIKLQLSDLESVGKLGYVEGISNIIVKNLKELDVTKRPVHCTDKKREVLYIKDQDKWEKEDEYKQKMHKVIRKVACKNQRLIPKFKEEHPDCGKYNSKFSDQYNKIIVESMGGSGDNDYEKEEKIIQKISREVIVDK
jgi:hypothetical protein